jgi:hypothetical protein
MPVEESPRQVVVGLFAVQSDQDVAAVGAAVDELRQVQRFGDAAEFRGRTGSASPVVTNAPACTGSRRPSLSRGE